MKPLTLLAAFAAAAALAFPVSAADKAKEQAEIQKASKESLQKFYQKKPAIEGEVKAAPGYAIFRTYGLSFHRRRLGRRRPRPRSESQHGHLHEDGASLRGPPGRRRREGHAHHLQDEGGLRQLREQGVGIRRRRLGVAGAGGHTAGGGSGQQEISDATTYTLTRNGLDVGGALQGTKFWKDKDLN
jgi:hypothetical protein